MDSRERRLLLVSTDLGIGGGAEQQVLDLALSFHGRGWQVRMVSMVPPSALPPEIGAAGIEVTSLAMKRGRPWPGGLRRLIAILKQYRPHVVHCHMTHANLLGRVARAFQPVPVLVCTLHGMRMYSVKGRFTWFRELGHRLTDRWSNLTTTVCRAAAAVCVQTRSVPKHKLAVVYNGLDTSCYAPNPAARTRLRESLGVGDGEFVWLAAGRFERAKDYPTMLRAFAQAQGRTQAQTVLLICGVGSMEEQLRALAQDLRISGRVSFLGLRHDIPDVMAAADAFVLSSETEGLPMVLLQASACGLPVVATHVGGVSEAVLHGHTGSLVRPGRPSELAAAMVSIAAMPEAERQQLGAAGREYVERSFSIRHIASRWECIYERLLANPASSTSVINSRRSSPDDDIRFELNGVE